MIWVWVRELWICSRILSTVIDVILLSSWSLGLVKLPVKLVTISIILLTTSTIRRLILIWISAWVWPIEAIFSNIGTGQSISISSFLRDRITSTAWVTSNMTTIWAGRQTVSKSRVLMLSVVRVRVISSMMTVTFIFFTCLETKVSHRILLLYSWLSLHLGFTCRISRDVGSYFKLEGLSLVVVNFCLVGSPDKVVCQWNLIANFALQLYVLVHDGPIIVDLGHINLPSHSVRNLTWNRLNW